MAIADFLIELDKAEINITGFTFVDLFGKSANFTIEDVFDVKVSVFVNSNCGGGGGI